ncbi:MULTISPECIES: tetratricopeptide repeat protein [unclassified Roseitalea]|uniref:tetratricopeptide repeat protein n=1 Tax=unclassified Roseitalea TaxID=2639107 RepID=UPI00273E2DA4|nr:MULTISPECIES: tetratricopeptide repeat protein [unclassified Roseitalea]
MMATKRFPTRVAIAACLIVAVAGTGAAQARADTPDTASTRSFAGAYLAANAARGDFDFDAASRYYMQALRFDPQNESLQRELMIALVTDGQVEAAIPYARALKDSRDSERVARLVLGVDAVRDGRYGDAEPLLILYVENELERLLTGVMRAWARHGAGDTQGALSLLDELSGPEWYALFVAYHGGLIADAAGLAEDAERRFEDALNNSAGGSASPLTYIRLAAAHARFLARQGRVQEAAEIIERGLGIAPNNPDLLVLRQTIDLSDGAGAPIGSAARGVAEILLNLGSAINRDGAEEFAALYLELARSAAPGEPQILFELGTIAERLGQPEKAIGYYAEIDEEAPLAHIAALQRGLALSDLGRDDEAKATLGKLIAENPTDFRGYLALGGVHASLREFEEAASVYERAIETMDLDDPRFWQLHYRLGIAYERTDRWPEAERVFKYTLTLSPDQPDVLNYLGYSWIDMSMHLDEGIEMIRKAVEQRPRDGYIVDSLGWAYYRLGEFDKAVEHLERATELRPRDAIINDHLGDAYWRVGRMLEATYQWSRVLGMEMDEEDLALVRAKLEAAQTPDIEPAIATSRVDEGAAEQAEATAPTDNDG